MFEMLIVCLVVVFHLGSNFCSDYFVRSPASRCGGSYYCYVLNNTISSFFADCEMNKEVVEKLIEIKGLAGKGVENPKG
jgi:hypothetical protein